jgi:hypothetical protein
MHCRLYNPHSIVLVLYEDPKSHNPDIPDKKHVSFPVETTINASPCLIGKTLKKEDAEPERHAFQLSSLRRKLTVAL